MPSDLGLLGVIFAIVPGYIADMLFRATWGVPKGDEFDRSLRSIIWSVLGLVMFAAVWGSPPSFISVWFPESTPKVDAFDWWLFDDFALDVAFCSVATFLVGFASQNKAINDLFARVFRHSLTIETPWDFAFNRLAYGRNVRVVLDDDAGTTYVGSLAAASQGSDEKELVIYDPSIAQPDGKLNRLRETRFIYVPEDSIRAVHFSLTKEEAQP